MECKSWKTPGLALLTMSDDLNKTRTFFQLKLWFVESASRLQPSFNQPLKELTSSFQTARGEIRTKKVLHFYWLPIYPFKYAHLSIKLWPEVCMQWDAFCTVWPLDVSVDLIVRDIFFFLMKDWVRSSVKNKRWWFCSYLTGETGREEEDSAESSSEVK